MKGLLALILFLPIALPAQNYLMNGSPITTCSGTFYDSGGPTGNYGNNQNLSTTICADGSGGTHARLAFSGANLAAGDVLCFYDGPNAAAPLLSCSSDYPPGQPFVVQATATNPSGCITVVFQSDAAGTATGWAAAISCVASCQTVLANLVSTLPVSAPADTGWIDICPGQRVFFNGTGIYPQNNFAYPQSDFSTTFEWNFGDGGIAYGPNTSHRFNQPGGYYVQLHLTDTLGCRSTNLISQRVRVAPRPQFALEPVSRICAGDTLHLSAAVDGATGATLSVTPVSSSFELEGSRADSLALPDGTGELYQTSIFLTEFSPGQIMVSANDLESICVNMEHSWARDIEITLTCPNGQSIILHDHPGNFGSEVFLGIPNDNDNFSPIPGLGFDYCWTPNATNPTWIVYANTVLGGSGTIPAGDYSTFDPISNLIGCPLNGEWTIGVTDYWPADNGFIFNWSIKFQDVLYPNIESFSPQFVSWGWNNHPSIFYADADSIAASPQNAGTAGFTFQVTDEFGCVWDTLVSVPILPFTHPDCYVCASNFPVLADTTICVGESVAFNAGSLTPGTQEVRFEAFPDYRLGNANHPHSNPYQSPISVNSLGFNFLTVPIQQISSVCLDIETDFAGDLNIFLRTPSGQLLMLSTGNGGAGDNYKITCFSPSATVPIVGQAAPFNGTYIPEGNWNTLAGAAVVGDWSLVVSDGFAPSQFGKVLWWSIGFNAQNTVNYAWSNSASLSCSNCPNPTATPSATINYVLTATDNHNCVYTDTVSVSVNNFFPAPTGLIVFELGPGTMTWVWDAVPSALGYEVSVNGGPWESPNNGLLSHIISGVAIGQTVNIAVRSISPSACLPAVESASSMFPNCMMVANVDSTTDLLCAGDSSGSAVISATAGDPPLLFFLDNNPVPFPSGNFTNVLSGGAHTVIVLDGLGCRDTVSFVINGPAPLAIAVSNTHVLCNGDNSGEASATATGGTGAVAFAWRNCLGGPVLGGATQTDLFAGCYAVTVTDENGCTATQSTTITEPPPYNFVVQQDSVSCAGLSDGGGSIVVTGGTAPYTYLWDNGGMTDVVTNLSAGFHFVTVTDANLCAATTFAQVLEPPMFMLVNTIVQSVSCFGGNNGAARVIVTGGTPTYQFLWNDPSSQNTAQATTLSAGNYQVTVTDWNGCTLTASATVGTPPALLVGFVNVAHERCANDCIGQATISPGGGVGGYTFSWSDSNIPVGAQTALNLCPGIYTVTVSDNNGCTASNQVEILPALPISAQFVTTTPSCAGLTDGSIVSQVSGGSAPYSYLWSNGSTSPSAQNLPCGPLTLTITDALGCVELFSINIDCPQSIDIVSIIPQNATCFGGNNGSISVQTIGGTPPLSFLWNDPNTQTQATAQNLLAGQYTVTVTDANGCTTTASAVVSEPPVLLVGTTVTNASCLNAGDGMAVANPSGGTGTYTYSWGATGTTQAISNLAAGIYFVTVTDANLCTATASATISQPGTIVSVSATQTRFACFGESDGQASVSASGGNGAPFVFTWSNGQTGGGASGLATGLYTVTATDSRGCSGTQVVAIQELDSIEIRVAYVPPTCAGYSDGLVGVVLIEGGLGMGDSTRYNYQWSLPGAPNATLVSGFSAGNYTVVASDLQGCTGSISFQVIEPDAVMVQLAAENVSCFGFSDGSIRVLGVQNAVGAINFQWSNGANTQNMDSLTVGTYSLSITDSRGCTAMASTNLTQPNPITLSFQTQHLTCAGDLNGAVSTMVSGGTPVYIYQWSSGSTTAGLMNLGAGVYQLQVIDQNGCFIADSVVVSEPNPINLSVGFVEPTCFGGLDGRLLISVSGGTIPYRYGINGGPLGGSNVFIALGAGQYSVVARDANGCTASRMATLGQPAPIEVLLGLDTSIVLGDSLLISSTVNNAVGITRLEWSSVLMDSFYCASLPECDEIWVKPGYSNIYRLKVTDENGCMGRSEIRVGVEKPRGIYVPTGFTPNGDFENDLLVVHGKSQQVRKVLVFKIFDRWGELLYEDRDFQVNDTARGWDGTFRGQPCDPAAFVWLLEAEYVDGYIEQLHGHVTLLR